MENFFKSRRFKILCLLLVLTFFFTLSAAYNQNSSSMLAKLTGYIITPVQGVVTNVSRTFSNSFSDVLHASQIRRENDSLKAEIALLREKQVDYDYYKSQNQYLMEYLKIQERDESFKFMPATIIGRDSSDRFYSFTIDKGSKNGISYNDTVITPQGLVGIISHVGPTFSKVITILDTTVEIGVMDSATQEVGVTEGNITLSLQGNLMMSYLPRDCKAAIGDIIITTGVGGMYPKGLAVGEIISVSPDSGGLSNFAVIKPYNNVASIQNVMVITSFSDEDKGE